MKTNTYFWSYVGQFLLKWEIFRTEVAEKIKTQYTLCSITPPENRAVYEITWKNIVEPSMPQMTIRRMRIAYWIT